MTSPMAIELFNEIMSECKHGRGGRLAHFSGYVRNSLEQYERKVRKEIVSRKQRDCAPLHHACEMGRVQMVEYLISICGADVDQTGRLNLHDFETTPLQRVCYMATCYRNFEVAKCLVEHGADIDRADASGRTCLMGAVSNVDLCELLLNNGANVNARDRRNKTALHYAIEGENVNTVKLLLDYGADATLRSIDNDAALRTACLVGCRPLFDYFVEHGSYSPGRLADANELMGSCRYFHGREMGLHYWRKAIEIRNSNAVDGKPLAKTPSMPKRDCYRNASEFTTLDELDAIALDSDALQIQKLLIHERILGEHHRATFDALKGTGTSYIKSLRYKNCFDIWRRALEISTANDSILWSDVATVAQGLVRALYKLHEQIPLEAADPNRVNKDEQSRFADVVATFKLLTNRLVTAQPPSREELLAKYSERVGSYDAVLLKCITHLMDLLVKTARTSEAKDEVWALVRHLVNRNPMTPENHDTLLHLCVSSEKKPSVSTYFPYHAQIFPNLEVTKLLLECEADVNAQNENGETPLHLASCPPNIFNPLVKLLLDYGAHLDTRDKWGRTPRAFQISVKPHNTVDLAKHLTLQCLAAQAIVKYKIQCNDLPASVNQFVDLHRQYKSKQHY